MTIRLRLKVIKSTVLIEFVDKELTDVSRCKYRLQLQKSARYHHFIYFN